MNKALYIIGIVFSVLFLIVCGYYVSAVSMARLADLFATSYDPFSSEYSRLSSDMASRLTVQAACISLFFFLFFIVADVFGVLRVKTRTMRAMGVTGIVLGLIFLIWDFVVLSSPGALSFDEVGLWFMLYSFIAMAFSIVGLIQSIRFSSQHHTPNTGADLLDS